VAGSGREGGWGGGARGDGDIKKETMCSLSISRKTEPRSGRVFTSRGCAFGAVYSREESDLVDRMTSSALRLSLSSFSRAL
jgi:hypothetical protein